MTLAAFKTRRPEQCELSFLDAGFPAPSFERSQRKDVHHPELPFSSDQPGPVARAHDSSIGQELRQSPLELWWHLQAALSFERSPPRQGRSQFLSPADMIIRLRRDTS